MQDSKSYVFNDVIYPTSTAIESTFGRNGIGEGGDGIAGYNIHDTQYNFKGSCGGSGSVIIELNVTIPAKPVIDFEILNNLGDLISTYSHGMKQKLVVIAALIHKPKLLVLDEPFVGLDPLGVNQLISILKQWSQERNISMIISSHQLGELEALCNRYVYIEGGRLETEMQIQSAPSVIIQLKDDLSEVQLPLELFESIQDGKIEVTIDSEADYLNQLMYTLSSQKAIKKIEIKENHLKDYFEMGD